MGSDVTGAVERLAADTIPRAFVRLADEMERRAGAEYAAVCEEQHGAASQPAGESPAPGGDE